MEFFSCRFSGNYMLLIPTLFAIHFTFREIKFDQSKYKYLYQKQNNDSVEIKEYLLFLSLLSDPSIHQ